VLVQQLLGIIVVIVGRLRRVDERLGGTTVGH
jgi:hypothetical protein